MLHIINISCKSQYTYQLHSDYAQSGLFHSWRRLSAMRSSMPVIRWSITRLSPIVRTLSGDLPTREITFGGVAAAPAPHTCAASACTRVRVSLGVSSRIEHGSQPNWEMYHWRRASSLAAAPARVGSRSSSSSAASSSPALSSAASVAAAAAAASACAAASAASRASSASARASWAARSALSASSFSSPASSCVATQRSKRATRYSNSSCGMGTRTSFPPIRWRGSSKPLR